MSSVHKGFGDIKTLNGETYQIYDPVQLYAAGVSSTTGMSFTLSASAPNWSPGGTCGGPATKDLSGSLNCFSTGSGEMGQATAGLLALTGGAVFLFFSGYPLYKQIQENKNNP